MKLVIFDLDGTLVDSKQDLVNAVNATRENLSLQPLPDDQVASYVGNGAPTLIQRAMPEEFTQQQLEDALNFFYGYYRAHMMDFTRPYPGVVEALDALKTNGARMAVLTNKPVRFSRDLVRGLGLGDYFFQVYGGNSFEEKKPHPLGLQTLMKEAGATQAQTWMVGDSYVDVLTARNAGVKCAGVTYGIQPESFEQTPPDILIDNMNELPAHVMQGPAPKHKS